MAKARKKRQTSAVVENVCEIEEVEITLTWDTITMPRTLSPYMALQVIPLTQDIDVDILEEKTLKLQLNTGNRVAKETT